MKILISYVEKANKAIYEYQENNKDSEGMGTTMTAIKIDESGVLHVAHVGDSRCYVLSKRNLIKLTEDENVPGYQNVLLQALGTKKNYPFKQKILNYLKEMWFCYVQMGFTTNWVKNISKKNYKKELVQKH